MSFRSFSSTTSQWPRRAKLSPLEDHTTQPATRPSLPSVVSLPSLIDPDGIEADRIGERWGIGHSGRRLRVVVGVGETGPIELDLGEDGPHALIVGAARSGKSELLRTIIASLVTTNEPSAVNVICVEPSDGSSFGAFAGLDHIVGSVDRFDRTRRRPAPAGVEL